MAGYSGTPLVRKLGIKAGMTVLVLDAPAPYGDIVPDLPAGLVVRDDVGPADVAHLFVTRRDGLAQRLRQLGECVRPDGMVWVSWPKKAARVPTDVTEDVVLEAALAAGLVDVKVCALDETWSGLKLVYRLADR